MVAVAVVIVIPGDAVVWVVPVDPGEGVEREEAAPHQVARHPTTAAALSIQSTVGKRGFSKCNLWKMMTFITKLKLNQCDTW